MIRMILGGFLILHGLVHLLYVGQSWRLFELQPGMVWPDNSWAFSAVLGDQATKLLATILLLLAAAGFVTGGIGLLLGQTWWRPAVVGVAIFAVVIFALFWDGTLRDLDDQGAIGILIDLGILNTVLLLPGHILA